MRTLSEMVARVKVYVRAAENLTWSETDYVNALEDAANMMWRQLAETAGSRCLRAFHQVTLLSDCLVAIPEDCLHVERVQFVNQNDVTVDLPYVMPASAETDVSWPHSSVPWRTAGWTDDQAERVIRVFGVPVGRTVKLVYVQEPVFPFENDGTFRAPDGEATETYPAVPELSDSACEHFAAALLCSEELSDTVPIGYHGQQYSALLKMMQKAMAVNPSRKYVRRVGGRR